MPKKHWMYNYNDENKLHISLNCVHLLTSGKFAKFCMYLPKKLSTLCFVTIETCVFEGCTKRFSHLRLRLQVVDVRIWEKKSIRNRILRSKFEIEGQFCMGGWNVGFGVEDSGFVSNSLFKFINWTNRIQKQWYEEHSLQLDRCKFNKTVDRNFAWKKFENTQKYPLVPFEKEFLEILPTRPPTFSALKTPTCAWKLACKTPGTQLQEISGNEPSKILKQYENMSKFWK